MPPRCGHAAIFQPSTLTRDRRAERSPAVARQPQHHVADVAREDLAPEHRHHAVARGDVDAAAHARLAVVQLDGAARPARRARRSGRGTSAAGPRPPARRSSPPARCRRRRRRAPRRSATSAGRRSRGGAARSCGRRRASARAAGRRRRARPAASTSATPRRRRPRRPGPAASPGDWCSDSARRPSGIDPHRLALARRPGARCRRWPPCPAWAIQATSGWPSLATATAGAERWTSCPVPGWAISTRGPR